MAIESKRGCGYRKAGGLYLVARPEDVIRLSCDRMPMPLHICPVCSQGIKFSRSWTWIEPYKLFEGDHFTEYQDRMISGYCTCEKICPVCFPSLHFIKAFDGTDEPIKAGLVWIGEKYYTPESFIQELNDIGFSKRLPAIPNGYKPGVTWIFTAHKKAVTDPGGDLTPGIFYAVQAPRIEKIVLQSEFDSYALWKKLAGDDAEEIMAGKETEHKFNLADVPDHIKEMWKLEKKGIDLIPVPDDDKDHNPDYKPEDRQLKAV